MDKKSWEKKNLPGEFFFLFFVCETDRCGRIWETFCPKHFGGWNSSFLFWRFFFFHVWNRIKKIINFLGHFCFLIDMFNFFCLPYAPCGTRLSSRSLKTQIFKILKADFWVSIPTRQTLGQPGKSFLGKKKYMCAPIRVQQHVNPNLVTVTFGTNLKKPKHF